MSAKASLGWIICLSVYLFTYFTIPYCLHFPAYFQPGIFGPDTAGLSASLFATDPDDGSIIMNPQTHPFFIVPPNPDTQVKARTGIKNMIFAHIFDIGRVHRVPTAFFASRLNSVYCKPSGYDQRYWSRSVLDNIGPDGWLLNKEKLVYFPALAADLQSKILARNVSAYDKKLYRLLAQLDSNNDGILSVDSEIFRKFTWILQYFRGSKAPL